jgi:hypothetical protein
MQKLMPDLSEEHAKDEITSMQLLNPFLVIIAISVTLMIYLPVIHMYAQSNTNTKSFSQSLSGLINSIALLVGVVAPVIVSGLAYVKAKSQDPKIKEAADTGIYVGQLATATANKGLKNNRI